MDKNRYTILKTSIAGLNMYRNSESLWIDNKTFLPAKLLVYDLKGNAVITVIFETIKLNTEINDMIFEVGG
jgi:outer membrane lipoprotein-sorting protein